MVYKFGLKMLFSFGLFITGEFIFVWWPDPSVSAYFHVLNLIGKVKMGDAEAIVAVLPESSACRPRKCCGVSTEPQRSRRAISDSANVPLRSANQNNGEALAAPGAFSAPRCRFLGGVQLSIGARNDRRLINMCERERSNLDRNKNAKERAETFRLSLKNNNARRFFGAFLFTFRSFICYHYRCVCLRFAKATRRAAEALAVRSPVSFRLLARNNV